MHADGFRQIFVTFAIVRDDFAHFRQQFEGVEVIELGDHFAHRLGELQHQQTAARLQYPEHGGERLILVGNVAQAEANGDDVEMVVREGERLGVGLNVGDVVGHPQVPQLVATHLEHGVVDVGQYHLTGFTDDAGELGGQIAGTTGKIQHLLTLAHTGAVDGEALPQAVDAERHQIVHQIILGCHRMEDAGDQGFLLGRGHGFKAKMRCRSLF